jgi:4-amino-4-deoxy-L-arabinose transferase-like glycosyltransferase
MMADNAVAKRIFSIVLLLFVILAVIYSVIIPPFETPDEIWHFAFIQHVASGQGLPVSQANTQALWRQQGVQAPAYYLAAAALTAWIEQSDFPTVYARANPHRSIGQPDALINRNYLVHKADEGWPWRGTFLALHIARLFSVALGAVTLWASYRALCLLVAPQFAVVGVALLAFIPQFLFISAAASNDNAVNACAALVLWRLLAVLEHKRAAGETPSPRNLLLLGVLLGLALLSKLSALGLAGLAGLAILWLAWQEPGWGKRWRFLLQAALYGAVPALLIAGWWYLRNWRLYGDPLAWNVWRQNILLRVNQADWRTIVAELGSLERSFWGLFGWMNVAYPEPIYWVLRALALSLAAGVCFAIVTGRSDGRRSWMSPFLLLGWLALLTWSWLSFMRIAPAAQGRYFFPAAPTLSWLAAIGLQGWQRVWPGRRMSIHHTQGHSTSFLGIILPGALLLLSVLTPFWLIRPTYQPPPLRSEAAAQLSPLQISFAGKVALIGAQSEPTPLQAGATASITLAWQALTPIALDYSIFVHLVDEEEFIVAQLDTMPGGGLSPTSQWPTGQVRVERYQATIPTTVYTPNWGSWRVGLYDAATGQRAPVIGGGDSWVAGAWQIAPEAGVLPNNTRIAFADHITLVGYEWSSRTLHAGQTFTATLYWQAEGPVGNEYTLFAHLLDESGQMRGGQDLRPETPMLAWNKQGVVRSQHSFVIPGDAPAGIYQVEIGLYTQSDFNRLMLLNASGAEGADRLLLGPLRLRE